MELPVLYSYRPLQRLLEGTSLASNSQKAAGGLLSGRYRSEIRDGRLHLGDRPSP